MNKSWRMQCALRIFYYSFPAFLLLILPTAAALYHLAGQQLAFALCAVAAISLTVGFSVWAARGWREDGSRLLGRSGFLTVSELSLEKSSIMGISQTVSPLHKLAGAVRFEILGSSGARCSLLIGAAQAQELSRRLIGKRSRAQTVITHKRRSLRISDDMVDIGLNAAVKRSVCIPTRAIGSVFLRQFFSKRSCFIQSAAGSTLLLAGASLQESEEIFLSVLPAPQDKALLVPEKEKLWLSYCRRIVLVIALAVFFLSLSQAIGVRRNTVLLLGALICSVFGVSAFLGAAYSTHIGVEICADQVILRTVRLFSFEERRFLRTKLACVQISAGLFERMLGVCSVSFYPSGERRAVTIRALPYDRARALILDRGL